MKEEREKTFAPGGRDIGGHGSLSGIVVYVDS